MKNPFEAGNRGMPPQETEAPFTTTQLEQKMTELRHQLTTTEQLVQEAYKEYRAAESLTEEARHPIWKKWTDLRKKYAQQVEDVANQEVASGEKIAAPNGRYSIDLEFPRRKQGKPIEMGLKKIEIYEPMTDTNLGVLVKRAWGEIVNLGIHNYGFGFPDEDRKGTCVFTLHGPENFSYKSSIFIDQSGHTVRRANDVR